MTDGLHRREPLSNYDPAGQPLLDDLVISQAKREINNKIEGQNILNVAYNGTMMIDYCLML